MLHVPIDPAIHSPTRLAVLMHLARAGGRARSRDMRLAIGVEHRATLAIHRKKLAAAGLIKVDGRTVDLTPAGRNALAELAKAINGALRKVVT